MQKQAAETVLRRIRSNRFKKRAAASLKKIAQSRPVSREELDYIASHPRFPLLKLRNNLDLRDPDDVAYAKRMLEHSDWLDWEPKTKLQAMSDAFDEGALDGLKVVRNTLALGLNKKWRQSANEAMRGYSPAVRNATKWSAGIGVGAGALAGGLGLASLAPGAVGTAATTAAGAQIAPGSVIAPTARFALKHGLNAYFGAQAARDSALAWDDYLNSPESDPDLTASGNGKDISVPLFETLKSLSWWAPGPFRFIRKSPLNQIGFNMGLANSFGAAAEHARGLANERYDKRHANDPEPIFPGIVPNPYGTNKIDVPQNFPEPVKVKSSPNPYGGGQWGPRLQKEGGEREDLLLGDPEWWTEMRMRRDRGDSWKDTYGKTLPRWFLGDYGGLYFPGSIFAGGAPATLSVANEAAIKPVAKQVAHAADWYRRHPDLPYSYSSSAEKALEDIRALRSAGVSEARLARAAKRHMALKAKAAPRLPAPAASGSKVKNVAVGAGKSVGGVARAGLGAFASGFLGHSIGAVLDGLNTLRFVGDDAKEISDAYLNPAMQPGRKTSP